MLCVAEAVDLWGRNGTEENVWVGGQELDGRRSDHFFCYAIHKFGRAVMLECEIIMLQCGPSWVLLTLDLFLAAI